MFFPLENSCNVPKNWASGEAGITPPSQGGVPHGIYPWTTI